MSTFSERKYNKIVWAFNPFDLESENDENAADVLRHFEKLENYELHPIFVFSPRYFLHPELEFEKSRSSAEIFPLLRMKDRLSRLNLKNLHEPRVLRSSRPSVRQEVSIFFKRSSRPAFEIFFIPQTLESMRLPVFFVVLIWPKFSEQKSLSIIQHGPKNFRLDIVISISLASTLGPPILPKEAAPISKIEKKNLRQRQKNKKSSLR
jgi:hypothetical protein